MRLVVNRSLDFVWSILWLGKPKVNFGYHGPKRPLRRGRCQQYKRCQCFECPEARFTLNGPNGLNDGLDRSASCIEFLELRVLRYSGYTIHIKRREAGE